MAQQLKALAEFLEDLGSILSTKWQLTIICNFIFREFSPYFWSLWAPDTHTVTYKQAKHSYVQNKNKSSEIKNLKCNIYLK